MTSNVHRVQPREQRDALSKVTADKHWLIALPIQMLFTWITFIPAEGEKPLFKSNTALEIAYGLIDLAIGVGGSYAALKSGLYPLIPICWIFTVGGARHLVVEIAHMATHNALFRELETILSKQTRIKLNAALGCLITATLFVDNFPAYRDNHTGTRDRDAEMVTQSDSHHGRYLATDNDADKRFIDENVGLKADDPEHNQQTIRKVLGSPKFYLGGLGSRIQSNLIDSPSGYRWLSWIWLAGVLAAVALTQSYLAFALSWVLPLTIEYQFSAICQLVTLHVWPYQPAEGESFRETQQRKTFNRILELMPPEGSFKETPLAWLSFWFVKLPLRFVQRKAIYVGALPVHGLHHLLPNGAWGMNAIYAAEELRRKGQIGPELVGGPEDFIKEAWKSR